MKPKLNATTMQLLYDFGALQVYEVKLLSELSHAICVAYRTFNQSEAEKVAADLRMNSITAWIETYFVKFDGAFSKQEKQEENP